MFRHLENSSYKFSLRAYYLPCHGFLAQLSIIITHRLMHFSTLITEAFGSWWWLTQRPITWSAWREKETEVGWVLNGLSIQHLLWPQGGKETERPQEPEAVTIVKHWGCSEANACINHSGCNSMPKTCTRKRHTKSQHVWGGDHKISPYLRSCW